jgi:hypothetical protein
VAGRGEDQRELGDVLRGGGQQVRHGERVRLPTPRRKVTYEEGAKFAKDNTLTFLEVSAKTAYQVEDAFKKNAELLLDKIEKGAINMESEVFLSPRSRPASRRATSPIPRSNSTSAASRPNPKRRNAVDATTCSLHPADIHQYELHPHTQHPPCCLEITGRDGVGEEGGRGGEGRGEVCRKVRWGG